MENAVKPGNKEPIAVVAAGCRFPGSASSPSKLWDLLLEKRDAQKQVDSRFSPAGFHHSNGERVGSLNVQNAYLIEEDVRRWDASFFGINAKEAEAIDPQHRILLETVYEAMENGGFTIEGMKGSNTAVYVGVMTHDYCDMLLRAPEAMPTYFATGTAMSILSNRVSYFFDWRGPSATVDTACSSSLVALHQAVQSLRNGESKVAVAGGANLILNPEFMAGESNLHMLSPEGRSRMWDHRANGYARGEAFATVMLKRLSDAIADGNEIQCVIRETGVNSDGRTQGITLPNSDAQARLIRQVYKSAGLDRTKASDRPQYFEAHGTGTPAGDPIEARGIREAFFDEELGQEPLDKDSMLYVGSVKTVVGHTEGTAGLAGLIKTMQAIRHGKIPGNMHFEKFNPKIIPFTDRLALATETRPWPALPPNTPRRASVNSFGFGGTNAHAILEEYKPETSVSRRPVQRPSAAPMAIPLVLSANNEKSLAAMLENFIDFIRKDEKLCLNDLAWTAQTKRSELALKACFSGPTRAELLKRMEEALAKTKEDKPQAIGTRRDQRTGSKPRILGIFTGQGAQWANMGREILLASDMAKKTVAKMDEALASLPDAPTWTIYEVLTEEGRAIDSAEFSQPICTAVQVMVIDILHSAGVEFSAVIGHSSGEMGAAYAAGCLSATDAIVIAFYRGLHTSLAQGPTGKEGSMMAAGMSFDDAEEYCSSEQFKDRLWVAASNAPASVTISGDADAIKEAKADLDGKGTFARALKVNKAYHSAHMKPVSQPYMDSLNKLSIKASYPRDGCTWISSVYGDRIQDAVDESALACTYWKDNMLRPVLFSTAIEQTVQNSEAFDLALEVGPHTALKGPFLQTYSEAAEGGDLPYSGTIMRKVSGVTALSDTFAFLMNYMAPSDLTTESYIRSMQSDIAPKFVTGLPNYPWDMSTVHWAESRYSRKYRQRERPRHELLGARLADDLEYDMRWRNTLRLSEVSWLEGHNVQGSVIFPAAGYLVMALEASLELVKFAPTKMVELLNVELSKAITLKEGTQGADTLLGLKKTAERTVNGETFVEADFSCFSAIGRDAENWDLNVKGRVRVTLANDSSEALLPAREPEDIKLTNVNADTFYDSMAGLGFNWTGLFRRLTSIQRRMNFAVCAATEYPNDKEMPVIIHPALMDSFFHAAFAALNFPEDGEMTSPYLPTSIKALRVGTSEFARPEEERELTIDATITERSASNISGDISVYHQESGAPRVQIEGLRCTCLERPGPDNDRDLYSETQWRPDIASLIVNKQSVDAGEVSSELEAKTLADRLALAYLRRLDSAITKKQRKSLTWTHQRIFDFVDSLLPFVASGQHPSLRKEWLNDDVDDLRIEAANCSESMQLRLVNIVGDNLVPFVQGEINLLECMMKDDLLNDYYASTQTTQDSSVSMSRMVEDVAHRYADMRILEISGGTTSTTKAVLDTIGHVYKSYTYTDVAASNLEAAKKNLEPRDAGLKFEVLDLTGDLSAQKFEEESYDLVIVSAQGKVSGRIFEGARYLLRPGGFLLFQQVQPTECLRTKFISLALPGWWVDEGSRAQTGLSATDSELTSWLQASGFAGIDREIMGTASQNMQTTVVLSQAMTDEAAFFRDTLNAPKLEISLDDICIIGKDTSRASAVTEIIKDICGKMECSAPRFNRIDRIEDMEQEEETASSVIFLQDLDEPIWENLSGETLEGFKRMLESTKNLLWVVSGSRVESAWAAASVGFIRSIWSEYAHINVQMLDVEPQDLDSSNETIASVALRLFAEESVRELSPKLLWTQEPELLLENGNLMLPRVKSDRVLNNRHNAERRPLYEEVDLAKIPVFVKQTPKGYALTQKTPTVIPEPPTSDVLVQVDYSMLHTIKVGDSYFYLNLGRVKEDGAFEEGTRVLALSNVHGSIIRVNPGMVVAMFIDIEEPEKFLQTTSTIFVAITLFSQLSKGSKILMFAPDQTLSSMFEGTARALGMDPLMVSATKGTPPSVVTCKDNIYINPNTTETKLREILPNNIEMFLNFSTKQNPESIQSLADVLNADCICVNAHDLFAQPPPGALKEAPSHLYEELAKSQFVAASVMKFTNDVETISLGDIVAQRTLPGHPCVIDFTADKKIQVQIPPVSGAAMFRSDKTYLLVGCTGGLGQSLCRWMIERGAKYLALTTRNPKNVNQQWKDELARIGGDVRFFACDVNDAKSLHQTYETICVTMPPIIGVANAAMLLADKPFMNQTLEDFQKVLKPKIDGTRQLDRLFSHTDLDFFILFSSLANLVGNKAQTNYAAANGFMQTIAAQRRKRGLTASVMNIGMVLGIGVVSEEGLFESQMKRMKWMPVSEPAVHNMFCQAILIGKPNSGHSHELTTGLARLSRRPGAEDMWIAGNPRFSHHVLNDASDDSAADGDAVPLRQQLTKVAEEDARASLIQDAFCIKLARVLGAEAESMERGVPLLALGIDSLMAVDVRSWFLAEIEVDLPVLKLLDGGTVETLCAEAATLLPESITAAAPAASEAKPEAPAKDDKKAKPAKAEKPAKKEKAAKEEKPAKKEKPAPAKEEKPAKQETPVKETKPVEEHKPTEQEKLVNDVESSDKSAKAEKTPKPQSLPTLKISDSNSETATPEAPAALSRRSSSDGDAPTPATSVASEDVKESLQEVNKELEQVASKDQYNRVGRMSFSQERLWFLQSFLTNPSTYNITTAYRVKGELRPEDFEQAFHKVIERHEALRTAFFSDPDTLQGMMGALKQSSFAVKHMKMTSDDDILKAFEETKNHHFDLENGETMKVTLLTQDSNTHGLVMGLHHLAVDAAGSALITKDFSQLYSGAKLTPLKLQYQDWADKQRVNVENNLSQDLTYWKQEFPDFPATIPLFKFASTKARQPLSEYKNRTIELRLDANITKSLKNASQRLRVTPFHIHLATVQSLLYKLLDVKDVCIGITDANNTDKDHQETLGFFVNLLPLRLKTNGEQSFASLAQKARDKALAALSHSQLPFNVIMEQLGAPRSNTSTPLFQVLMNWKMNSILKVNFDGLEAESVAFKDASNPYDLQFDVEPSENGTTLVTLTTQDYLYTKSELETVLNAYATLLKSLASKPALALQDHSAFAKKDLQAATELGKGPRIPVDEKLTIPGVFDQAAKRSGDEVAVVDNLDGSITWSEAAGWVNTYAAHLIESGVQPGAFVGVYAEPSVKSVCYWQAVLRTGAIYVPLDVSNPVSRLQLIIDDCKPAAIVCDASTADSAKGFKLAKTQIVQLADIKIDSSKHVDDKSNAHETALVIYTSGTTGTPKGTMLTHANFVNNIAGVSKQYNTDREVVLQATNLGFDLSLGQMMQFLWSAGKLVVASIQSRADPTELVGLMAKHKVTYTILTPSVYALLLRHGGKQVKECTSWRLAFSCGEALTSSLVKDFQKVNLPELKLINSCGPTEITVINSSWEIPLKEKNASEMNMLVGKTLPNYSTYILDEDLKPVATGLAGEMVVGGASISQGYLKKPELSTTKWVTDPFASQEDQAKGWTRMYRTGDRAKMLPDGNMQFLGRIAGDQQVQLRGVRIELGDVASTLVRSSEGKIVDAVVVLRGEADSAFLAAFVTVAGGRVPADADAQAKALLQGLPLPASMIPSRLVILDELPRTPNGKIDNRALISMDLPGMAPEDIDLESDEDEDEEDGTTTTEKTLRGIWASCLKQGASEKSMRKNTDFFQAGGNSMLLVNVSAKIKSEFGCSLRLYTMFQNSTLEAMALKIDESAGISTRVVASRPRAVRASSSVYSTASKTPTSAYPKTPLSLQIPRTPWSAAPKTPVSAVNHTTAAIDWKKETSIDRDLIQKTRGVRQGKPVARNDLEVVLTGATGFLGKAILKELIEDQRIAKVHCIAIRLKNGETSRELAIKSDKIERYYGNLNAPRLGLDEKAFADLAARADRIIHNGAEISFLKQYQSLQESNVGSTKIIFELAASRKVPIHFVSTAGVAGFYPESILPETFIPDYLPPTNGMGGYAASKWASEIYLQNCYSQCRLPVHIHRPSNILGEGAEEVNLTANIIEYSLRTSSAPRCDAFQGSIQFAEVEEVAGGIVKTLTGPGSVAGARVSHHCGDEIINISDLREYLEKRYNRELKELDLDSWLEAAQKEGLSDGFAALMGEVLRNEGDMAVFKSLGKEKV